MRTYIREKNQETQNIKPIMAFESKPFLCGPCDDLTIKTTQKKSD
jgi:hypothetical protein